MNLMPEPEVLESTPWISEQEAQEIALYAKQLVAAIEQVILGKSQTVELTVTILLCRGHFLIEDIPGVGKTTLAKAVARAIGGQFRRIQFTPDLLPSDITGSTIFNQKSAQFEFHPGPVFANVVLADEINRATPKTQSALLEAMEERTVSVDGVTYLLPDPFFVIATQNNVELVGTYPLPEAQLDRFFARVSLGYPDHQAEVQILETQQTDHPLNYLKPILSLESFLAFQRKVRQVYVEPSVREYIVRLVSATREHPMVSLGASPRGSLALMTAAQAQAAMQGRHYVLPDDVKRVAVPVLAHRLIIRPDLQGRTVSPEAIIQEILDQIAVPIGMKA